VAQGEEPEEAVWELWGLIEELEPAVLEGELDLERAWAFAVAVGRLAWLPPDRRPGGFEARELLELACLGADRTGDVDLRANARLKLGEELLHGAGHPPAFEKAREVFETALEELSDARGARPWLLLSLAKLERDFGSPGQALELAEELRAVLSGARPSDRPLLELALHDLLVEVEITLGTPDRALLHVRVHEKLAEESGDATYVLDARISRIQVLLAARQWRRAHRLADEALEWPAARSSSELRSELLFARGRATLFRGGPGSKDVLHSMVDDLQTVAGDESVGLMLRLNASVASAEGLWRLGARARARERIAQARARLAEVAGNAPGEGLSELRFALDGLASRMARTEGIGRAGLEALRTQLGRALEDLLARWEATPVRPGGVGFLHYENRRLVAVESVELAIALDGERGVRAALELLVRLQGYGSLARAKRIPPRLPDPFDGLVAADVGCLLFLPGLHAGHVFAVDASGVAHGRLPGSPRLDELRRSLVERVIQPPPDDPVARAWRAPARELGRALLPPAVRARVGGWRALHIVGGGILGYVPFELLPLGTDDGDEGEPLLGDALAVDYLPSVHVARLLRDRRARRTESAGLDLALLAAPKIEPALAERWPEAVKIPLTDRQARVLLTPFDDARAWRGPDASLEALADPAVAGARMLHLLTHGVEDRERVHSIGLVLAGSAEPVWYEELAAQAYPPLVVVTACRAGSAHLRRGEDGVADLAGAILSGGAQVVLLSPARREFGVALELATDFQGALADGASVAEALRRARRALAARPGRAHPFHGLVHAVGWGAATPFPDAR
jgi:tetratricopeptide (TPR) repeat protein